MSEPTNVTYHLYGRTEYAEPLAFVQTVVVSEGEIPSIPVGQTWLELVAFPETAVVRVLPREKERSE